MLRSTVPILVAIAVSAFSLHAADISESQYSAQQEARLTAQEKQQLRGLLDKDRFSKADFQSLEALYSDAYDRLTPQGQEELSKRLWGGSRSPATKLIGNYSPEKGFPKAQPSLTLIYLTIAASLQDNGSPIPYLKHVAAEQDRIAARYRAQVGKDMIPIIPARFGSEYINEVEKGWNHVSTPLGLESLARKIGLQISSATSGSNGQGTELVGFLTRHQDRIQDAMIAGDPVPSYSGFEPALRQFLQYDQPTQGGSEAAKSSSEIYSEITGLFKQLDEKLDHTTAAKLKTAITAYIQDVGAAAQAEFELAIMEMSLDQLRSASR